MTRLRILFIWASLTCVSLKCFSQNASTIGSLRKITQICLDSGWHMPSCEYEYFVQLDSILNIVYYKLQSRLNSTDKQALKKEQLKWLKRREILYSKSYKEYLDSLHSGNWGPEMRVIAIGDKTDFTEQRVLELIERLNK